MPEIPQSAGAQIIAKTLLLGAITTMVLAGLIYTGVIPVGEEMRLTGAIVVGIGGLAEVLFAIWFFRKGQSS